MNDRKVGQPSILDSTVEKGAGFLSPAQLAALVPPPPPEPQGQAVESIDDAPTIE
jgi:hypothetical protein